jgi:ABC-2 type transport system permease protein
MFQGLWKLTWLEIKIFMREPLGFIGTVAMPVVAFIALGRVLGGVRPATSDVRELAGGTLPVVGALLIAVGAVQSLVTIIAIYREGGILKRLRATPLRPQTILSAHVVVKLLLTAVTMAAMMAAGRRYLAAGTGVPLAGFAAAVLVSTLSILSIGFVVASLVPTARFAQPVASLVFYPMLALALVPADALPGWLRAATMLMPLSYAGSLVRGILAGEGWTAHFGDLLALALVFAICTALSAKVFRWE